MSSYWQTHILYSFVIGWDICKRSEFLSHWHSDKSRIMSKLEVLGFSLWLYCMILFWISDEDDGAEDLARCTVPMINRHSESIDLDSDGYKEVLQVLQKESGPRFSVMKEAMDSVKECSKGKSYSRLLESLIGNFYCNLCL